MPKLTGQEGEWNLPVFHRWEERASHIEAAPVPLIRQDTRIATVGSCFARELARAMDRFGLRGAMHPAGMFYNSRSIRQEFEFIFEGTELAETHWRVGNGFVHPFKDYRKVFETEQQMNAWSEDLDRKSKELFLEAEVIVITLGMAEVWRHPRARYVYRRLPHPDIFEELGPVFERLTVSEIVDDLSRIRTLVREYSGAKIILTVSPVPLLVTMMPLDVRVADCASKSRVRAAVSEFLEQYPDVHYFHSYELVRCTERMDDFMKTDGRHLHPPAVDYVLANFLAQFGDGIGVPEVDTDWMTPPDVKKA